jgi:hypothetical protein
LAVLLLGFLLSIQFVDAARSAGLTAVTYCGGAVKNHILESTGNGVLALDYDRDGFLDLYFPSGERFTETGEREAKSGVLYRNRGDGTFEDVTDRARVRTSFFGQGGAVGDVDDDGLSDLYLTGFGSSLLFRNNGDGTFSDRTERAGLAASGWSIGASFFDADGDSDQDLFVARYIEASSEEVRSARRVRSWRGKVDVLDGPKGLPGAENAFYRNEGNGTFLEATKEAGFDVGSDRYSMGVVTLDYDRDGDVDVYVANDSTPNALYRNRGDGTFEEVGMETGAAFNMDGGSQGSMGIDAGDFDNDGWLDLAVTNFAHDYYTLYRNLEGKLFVDESFGRGLALATFAPLGWGALFLDFDHDRDLDLFFANGHIYPQVEDDPSLGETYGQKNQLMRNDGVRFVDVTESAGEGLALALPSRGAASGDVDNDGDLDVIVSNEDEPPTLLRNESASSGHWVSIELVRGLGARVEVVTSGVRQLRQLASGGSYASQSDSRLHFGLGESVVVDAVEVRWPDGTRDVFRDLPADRRYVVKRAVALWAVP